MPVVRITTWRPGFDKVRVALALKACTDLSLADAGRLANDVAEGGIADIELPMGAEAQTLIEELWSLGAVAMLVPAN
jgi:hypothetical protein